MPIIKPTESLAKKEPIILIMGDQGLGKTSLGFTFEAPLHIDFDKGVQRSEGRKDTLQPVDWQEVIDLEVKGEFKGYKTIVIDTPKAALDDYLIPHVISRDSRLMTQKFMQQRFGAIGEEFKRFVNKCRDNNCVIVFICHAKKDEDGKISADITGQSLNLLMRIADQVSYITIRNNKRMMLFSPSEFMALKNTANLPEMEVPVNSSPEWGTFGQMLAEKVRDKIHGMSEAQREALLKSQQYQELIATAESLEELAGLADNITELPPYLNIPLTSMLSEKYKETIIACDDIEKFNKTFEEVNALPVFMSKPLRVVCSEKAKKMGWIPDEATKKFVAPPSKSEENKSETDPAAEGGLFADPATEKKNTSKKNIAKANA